MEQNHYPNAQTGENLNTDSLSKFGKSNKACVLTEAKTQQDKKGLPFYIKRYCLLCELPFEALRDRYSGYCSKDCRIIDIQDMIIND